jgi:very-short-patch-repair endonuclease
MEIKKCEFCFVDISNKKTKTCSRHCADELKKEKNREERFCLYCKNVFITKKTSEKKICSDECRRCWASLPENKEKRMKKTFEAVEKKYGVKHNFQIDSVKEKSKKTKLERYGDENYNNLEKNKKTKLERYGDENYNNLEKNKKTKLERYGDENYNNREKAEKTVLENYNVTHALKLDVFKQKQKETLYKNYGVFSPINSDIIRKKIIETNMERYGTDIPSKNIDIIKKIKQKNFVNFNETKLFQKIINNNIKLNSEYSGISQDNRYCVYEFECLTCHNKFEETFANNRSPVCKSCFPSYKNNNYQKKFKEFFNNLSLIFNENDRVIIKPYELDFYFPKEKIAIEINGNYFHSENGGGKDENYHINKTKKCNEKGISLIHIFEDEILKKEDIVFSMLKSLFEKNDNVICAKKCSLNIISHEEKNIFLEENHIQGSCLSSINLALLYENKIVSVMSFDKKKLNLGQKKSENGSFELKRFARLKNTKVVGDFSKLLKYFIKEISPKYIFSYSDIRWVGLEQKNTIYSKNGFEFVGYTNPNYWYFKKGDFTKRNHRFNFRKCVLSNVLLEMNINIENKTEWEMAKEIGMDRIWDCGYMKFEINL